MQRNFFKKLTKGNEEPLHVLVVAAEASPYANVGGFSRVVESLSKELLGLGVDVRVFTPKFGSIDEEKYKTKTVLEGLRVPTGDDSFPELVCNVKMHKHTSGVITYFLENMEYFEKRANVYGYSDDPTRWALLSRGALEFLIHAVESSDPQVKEFKPNIIQVNDWHTGLLPNYLRVEYSGEERLSNIAVLYTLHNLRYQGLFDPRNVGELDFDDGKSPIAGFFDERLAKQNFMRRGIIYADAVNTVSQTYSREILTPDFGEGLDRLLTEVRGKLYGVLNGIDNELFDPATDKLIEKNYDINDLEPRIYNKYALQKEFSLQVDETIPLLGFVGRLDYQKGIDLTIRCLWYLIKEFDVQFVQVGGGDMEVVSQLRALKEAFPKKVGLHTMPNFSLPRLFFAGCDMILYPSRFEPCGIVQLEAMRYGAIPVVRRVGGLNDSVTNFDPKTGKGTGFVFDDYDTIPFYGALVRAIETYRHKDIWASIQRNAMKEDFSWRKSTKEYIKLYRRAIEFRARSLTVEEMPNYL